MPFYVSHRNNENGCFFKTLFCFIYEHIRVSLHSLIIRITDKYRWFVICWTHSWQGAIKNLSFETLIMFFVDNYQGNGLIIIYEGSIAEWMKVIYNGIINTRRYNVKTHSLQFSRWLMAPITSLYVEQRFRKETLSYFLSDTIHRLFTFCTYSLNLFKSCALKL